MTEWAVAASPGVLILTGNAGTGKTALVEAYCESLGVNRPTADGLVEVAPNCFAVKDFSGIPQEERAAVVGLSREIRGGRAAQLFICANEGVLREALSEDPDPELEGLLSAALEGGAYRAEAAHGVTIVNMNRQRWTSEEMWGRLLDYFVREELWTGCEGCAASGSCPIKANAEALRRDGPREAARRLVQFASGSSVSTLRELLSIISHGITGGLNCEEVKAAQAPFDASSGYFNLLLGEGLSRERLERSTLIQEMRSAELGAVADVEVDGWLRDPESAPKLVGELAGPAEPTPHALVRTGIGDLTFRDFGETISVSDDPAKVEICLQDYVTGGKILELWRRRVFFEAQPALGGWKAGFSRLTNLSFFGALIEVAEAVREGRSTTEIRQVLLTGLNYLTAGFGKFGGFLVVPDPGSLASRNPGSFRLPEPSIVHSRVVVDRVRLEQEDGPELIELLDTDDVRIVLSARADGGTSRMLVTPRLFEVALRSGRFRSPAGADLPEMNELLGFYAALSAGSAQGQLEVVDPSSGVIRSITLPAL
ncbi:MAG TPA: hypothetical protein VGW80_06080 [Solirubrobacterales bacterium]|nr:hypothetical protein [Solirubrobacterales bacterium]